MTGFKFDHNEGSLQVVCTEQSRFHNALKMQVIKMGILDYRLELWKISI